MVNKKKFLAVTLADATGSFVLIGIGVLFKDVWDAFGVWFATLVSYFYLYFICKYFRIISQDKIGQFKHALIAFLLSVVVMIILYFALLAIIDTHSKSVESVVAFIFSRMVFSLYLSGSVLGAIQHIRNEP